MAQFALDIDEFGRLQCRLSDGDSHTTASSAEVAAGLADLGEAIDALEQEGFGECFWFISAGEYRWVFRRHEAQVRIAVMWCGSVAVGFQHVFWAECPLDEFIAAMRQAIAQCPVPAA
jgi:hypothetical protein